MIKKEYIRFMQTLGVEHVSDNTRKMANLVLDSFEDIAPLGTAAGRRVKKIVQLAQQKFPVANTAITVEAEELPENVNNIARIKSLTVGPFRGFANTEIFDLDNQIVLIYGPNGTGKSSFCEALEFGLLGSVEEAQSKHFRQTVDYLKNAHVGRFSPPLIEGGIENKDSIVIAANETQFRFCFVEKNRIDNFSRIAAHAPARQTELISSLFGLEGFNDFVRGFSAEIDERYIDLYGVTSLELTAKRRALEGHQQTIKTNGEALIELVKEENDLAQRYKDDAVFAEVVAVIGTPENPGEIQVLEAELKQPQPNNSGLKHADLLAVTESIEKELLELSVKEAALSKASEGLSFKQLFEAMLALTAVSPDNCPACKTPLIQSAQNPYELAAKGLADLEPLSTLERERDSLKDGLNIKMKTVHSMADKASQITGNEEQPNPLSLCLVDNDAKLTIDWWQLLNSSDEDGHTLWKTLEFQVGDLERSDLNAIGTQNKRLQKTQRLVLLRRLQSDVIRLQTKRQTMEEANKKAELAIAEFEEANKELITVVKQEKPVVSQNHKISAAYTSFVKLLNRYKGSLPGNLVADLGIQVVDLYNAFNRNDPPNHLLADIKLPLSSGEQIKISFSDAPARYFDALHVLSEGHIRCVGLAVLLAKNIKEGCSILIFDDPVNAIDDDHRESIRKTLFEDNYFENKQIILTCHGEEFFKDIQNLLGVERAKASRILTFLPQLNEKHIRVDFGSAPRNYIIAAQEHMDKLETRAALEKSRQALESLAKGKIWQYVSKHGDGNLSIKMRRVNAPMELRNLTEQLKIKISRGDFADQEKAEVLHPVSTLLGINGDSREWRYLNKGTHEEADAPEFDRHTVSIVVASLAEIDEKLA